MQDIDKQLFHANLVTTPFDEIIYVDSIDNKVKAFLQKHSSFKRRRNPTPWQYYKSLRNLTNKTIKLERKHILIS